MAKRSSNSRVNAEKWISVRGARTHNLKNIDVSFPREKMVVFTGVSGSGKSSLAFDTIFAEGQRRYVESLSSYARQFLQQFQKPDVDEITGLSPAISIDQKAQSRNPRSTVATITEIYDYLRVLFARIGRPHCLVCGREIQKLSLEEIKEFIFEGVKKEEDAQYVEIFSPVVRGRKGEYYQLLYDLLSEGFEEVIIDGNRKKLRERIVLEKNKTHDISVLVDRIEVQDFKDDFKSADERLSESIERSLEESGSLVHVVYGSEKTPIMSDRIYSSQFSCPHDGYSYPEVEPRLFSFNSPYGACEVCNGLGTKFYGSDEPCEQCDGTRLREEALNVFVFSKTEPKKSNIVDVTKLSIDSAIEYVSNLDLTEKEAEIAKPILREIELRLKFMENVGIEYLTLNRRAKTLSGGEAQRIRLASQLGSGLVGALYVLDEPTIGLHARDNDRLVQTLLRLRDLGNTIIVVEHDEDTIFSADYLVDIGPKAGVHGGKIVASGYIDELISGDSDHDSSTLAYLRKEKEIPTPKRRRNQNKGDIKIRGGNIHNIKNLNVNLPLGKLVMVTGVSGSGKSSFVYDILHKNLEARFNKRKRINKVYNAKEFLGTEYAGRAVLIDQSAIGRTSRSNPATYTGAFGHIRDLFAATTEAQARGWKPGRFSFNVKNSGRCEACQGMGEIAIEMHFLPTVHVKCDVCDGKRFTKETLEVKYKKKNIYEVLEMTVEEGLAFFEDIPAIFDRFKTLDDVGLGYLKIGQSATTLSGGEAQRVKIASELYRRHTEKTVYLLDEPTIGLHYEDVEKLIEILQRLVDRGNTVVVIEHNMDIIKSSDYIIDIGPEGGEAGGKIVAKGTPEDVARVQESYTGQYLAKALKKKK
ncbi:MAG: excinuclease ABC subunit UvrA [Candidatus Campbellbacteria bacterium]|nr:excinuclease ABC subunit UvrA [Candidatus Campbellbacteria bacterium]